MSLTTKVTPKNPSAPLPKYFLRGDDFIFRRHFGL
jgi:hypothetical protein